MSKLRIKIYDYEHKGAQIELLGKAVEYHITGIQSMVYSKFLNAIIIHVRNFDNLSIWETNLLNLKD